MALSRERIVDAAIALLDQEGEAGLTYRALAVRLKTGAGAIYHHVANKGELLTAAADVVIGEMLDEVRASTKPREAVRRIAVGVFEAIDRHPWLGSELSRAPWQTPMLQIFERLGRALGDGATFTSVSALANYILGVSAQNAANGMLVDPALTRAEVLATEAERWRALDADAYPFTRSVTAQMREHDDTAELLAGVDLILAGIARS